MRLLPLFFFLFLLSGVSAQSIPPAPSGYVLDAAGVFSDEQKASLESRLGQLEQSTTVEVAVYVFSSLEGGDMFLHTQEVFDAWKIGDAGIDNGLLIAISVQDREWRIHTGYGVEGTLPDGLAYRIGSRKMVPLLKDGDYFGGISAALDDVEALMQGNEEVRASYAEKDLFASPFELFGLGFGMALVAGGLLVLVLGKLLVRLPKEKRMETGIGNFFFILLSGFWILMLVGFAGALVIGSFFGFTALSLYFLYLLVAAPLPIKMGSVGSGLM
ncbi:MAG: TPM domain-containing protein, partial [archaeon]